MDPMKMLEMGHRSGVSQTEVDDFADRMDLISKAMVDIQNGTFDPATCNIPGYKTAEQEEIERQEQLIREAERRKREEERQRKAKQEEHDAWWHKAELRFSLRDAEGEDKEASDSVPRTKSAHWANRVLAAYKARDANDYSLWDQWEPEDPVSLQEQAEREAELDKLRNREFENSNPDFCNQFKQDMEERQRSQEEKARTAERLKRQGNRSYKKKQHEDAVKSYMQALASAPFNVAVLANLAQCFLRLDQLDDCIEFCSRALYIDANHVKALSRRATAWHKQKKWKQSAVDMRKALALDAENADVLEQHSIIVGDYEDAITDSELDLVLVAKDQQQQQQQQQQRRNGGDNSAGSPLSASTGEELRFSLELLKKMDEQTTVLDNSEPADQKRRVPDAWVVYDLLLPFLERNEHVRAKFRTSGEMNKLCDRLVAVMGDLEAPQVATKANARRRDEELIISAMFNCVTAAVADTPRNQAVLFRHVAFRTKLTEAFSALNAAFGAPSQATSVPWIVQASLARFLEEALGSKSWRSAVIVSDEAMTALLTILRINFDDRSMASDERAAKASLVLAGSGICFTLSSEASGLQAFASRGVDCLATVAQALETHSGAGSAVSLRNLLGFMTNLSTSSAIRTAIERDPCQETRRRLVQILLQIAQDAYCGGHSEPTVSPRDAVCSERALGALLNLSFAETSQLRRSDLLKSPAVETIERILAYASPASFTDSILVLSRAASLLCRLHVAFHGQSGVDESHAAICSRLSSVEVLSKLFEICQQANACFSGKSSAIPEELWQLCAQIWCHVGWCAHLLHVRAFLRQKQAVPLLLQVIALANAQKAYRRPNGKTTACERLVGNVVKVLIAMQTDRDAADAPVFRAQRNIAVLVSSLQTLADGLARKNVAILLAKLCQFDPKAKAAVRELRGIEMMLSISQSMKQAVAF